MKTNNNSCVKPSYMILAYVMVFLSCFSCSREDSPALAPETNKKADSPDPLSIEQYWAMRVNSVDRYVGNEADKQFLSMFNGDTLGLRFTTNHTIFEFLQDNKIKVYKQYQSIWVGVGQGIDWDINYKLEGELLTIEAVGNKSLSSCSEPVKDQLLNTFTFSGILEKAADPIDSKFVGTFKWQESHDGHECVRIEGKMDVLPTPFGW
ncbi:hypothetical protein SAMN03097699_1766 [Flavobacteriaceae bacterium MAR_2010_188]|nr:hypothetical protein SAMN03097699_1766 [Flavobacteriaceae bacterium MAR_2010_188]